MDKDKLKGIVIDEELVRDIAAHEFLAEAERLANLNPDLQAEQQQERKRQTRRWARDFLAQVYGSEGEP